MLDVTVIEDAGAAEICLDPVRARLLAELAVPGSATTLAATAGIARQKVNYQLKVLERHELVELVEERCRSVPMISSSRRLVVRSKAGRVLTQPESCGTAFASEYNHRRPHRSLPQWATPATAYAARPKAAPGDRAADTHDRVRTDRIWAVGTVTLRHAGKLHHIGVGRKHAGTEVLILTQDLHVRIIAKATGELLRELTLDPDRDYQPSGKPRPQRKTP
jgi:DNA-binding transcriptional ArsR family regulator